MSPRLVIFTKSKMASDELQAFWQLEHLNRLSAYEYFLPTRANRGEYTKRLKEAKQPVKKDGN